MSTQTPNLNLDLREASDIFNPLSTNSNFETLDSVITEIRKKGGVPTYTTTASANLLKLSENPVPNETLFKFVAAGDANTWSYQESVNNIVALDGKQKTVKGGEMYVAWVNAANAMVVIAWPDVVDAQTFDGKGPAEWASKAQLDAVNQTAANATTTAQAAATVANNALEKANEASEKIDNVAFQVIEDTTYSGTFQNAKTDELTLVPSDAKLVILSFAGDVGVEAHCDITVIPPALNKSITFNCSMMARENWLVMRTVTLKNTADGMRLSLSLGSRVDFTDNSTSNGVNNIMLLRKLSHVK